MAEKIPGDLGGGSRLSRFEPAFRAASTKRRMAKSGTWLRSRAREICAPLPPSGRPCSSGITPPVPEDGPLEGRHRRLPQMSPAHARHFGAAELRLISQPRRLLEALAWEIAAEPCGADDVGGDLRPYLICAGGCEIGDDSWRSNPRGPRSLSESGPTHTG